MQKKKKFKSIPVLFPSSFPLNMNFPLEKAVLQVSWFRNLLNYALGPSLSCLDVPWKLPVQDATAQDLSKPELNLTGTITPPGWSISATQVILRALKTDRRSFQVF